MKNQIIFLAALALLASCSSTPEYDAQGTFEATEVIVSAEGTGRIIYLDINEGDLVRAATNLGLIDTLQLHLQKLELAKHQAATLKSRPDLASQAASLRRQIAGATTERDRVSRLLTDGAATQKQLDELNTRIASLEGQLEGLMSQIRSNTATLDEKASAVEIQMAAVADKIERCRIQSPIDGVVLTKFAQPGEVAAYGKPLFKVADVNNMYVRAYFTSEQLADLYLGRKVTVQANYGGDKLRDYPGTITYIASESEFTPKTIQTRDSRANLVYAVKIAVPNDGLLKIGLSANVLL